MKQIAISVMVLLCLFTIISCGNKTKNNESNKNLDTIESYSIHIPELHIDNNWNKLDNAETQLTKAEYDDLKLGQLSFMGSFGELQYERGDILIDDNSKKLLTIKAISSGEISEYLLGYIDNMITDSLLVAYEDNVEYFSVTSSIIKADTITVTTINFEYNGMDEVADTIVSSYRITPELKFDEIIK